MGVYIINWSLADWKELLKWAKIGANNAMIGEFAEVEEIPPHGRLIEATEITEHKYTTIPSHRKEYADGKPKSEEEIIAFKFGWNYAIDAIVENAPTVIPASDKDTNVLGKEESE